jgi:hypothetical protein
VRVLKFEVFMVVKNADIVCWVMTSGGFLGFACEHFGGTCCLGLTGSCKQPVRLKLW